MRRAAVVPCLLVLACTELRGLSEETETLGVVRGRVTVVPGDACNLRAALLWTAVPVFVPYCHEHGPTPLDPDRKIGEVARLGCRDPFEIVPATSGPSVALTPGQETFEIPLLHLPPAAVMVGTAESRVAYASLIVFDDLDGNGALTFYRTCVDDDDDRPLRADCRGREYGFEPIYASSFHRLDQQQERITYVEGAFDAGSYFYPHPGCDAMPGAGFSLWSVGSLLHEGSTCSVEPIDRIITLRLQTAEELVNLTCTQSLRESFPRPPSRRVRIDEVVWSCNDDGSIAYVEEGCVCPRVRTVSLRGCYDEVDCATPDWELPVPEEWPCSPAGAGE